jgi:hypothetical protein
MTHGEQQALAFLRRVSASNGLQHEVGLIAGEMSLSGLTALAATEGMEITEDDIRTGFAALSRLNEAISALYRS